MTSLDPPATPDQSRREALEQRVEELEQRVEAAFDHVKPKLRGWLHVGMVPVALMAGIVLVVLASTTTASRRRSSAAPRCCCSAPGQVYHRGTWSPRMGAFLRRFDHSNIFIIAGTYTPFALLLPPDQARHMLTIVWAGAIIGVLFRVFWSHAPRWLYVPAYVMLGWVAVFYFGPLLEHAGAAVMTWIVIGGAPLQRRRHRLRQARRSRTSHRAGSASTRSSTRSRSRRSGRTPSLPARPELPA